MKSHVVTSEPKKKVVTLFCPQTFCPPSYAAVATGGKAVKLPTTEAATSIGRKNLGPANLIYNVYLKIKPIDLNTKTFSSFFSYVNPINLLSYVLGQGIQYYFNISVKTDSQETSNESLQSYSVNFTKLNFGQEGDIKDFHDEYCALAEEVQDCNVVVYATSKGCAKAFNALAKHKFGTDEFRKTENIADDTTLPKMQLVILEGCFYHLYDAFHGYPYIAALIQQLVQYITDFKFDGPSPGKSIKDFPEGIPVAFITSEKDMIVPWESTEKLAKELAQRNKNEVYYLKLKNSSHQNYLFDDEDDRKLYLSLIHALYKKYNLLYDPELAVHGQNLIQTCLLKPENCEIQVHMDSESFEMTEYSSSANRLVRL